MSLVISVIELVKSVCECCENARWNKRTSGRVRTCVKAFEDVLKRMRDTGSWEKHQDALSSLRDALNEAETVLKRITGRSSISAMRHASEDLRQLRDLEKRLEQASDLLQVNFHVSAEQQASDLNADLLELIKISGTDNQNMHEQTQLQIEKLTEMLQGRLEIDKLNEQLSQVSVAIDADEKGVTAADVGVFAKEALVVGVKNYASSPLRNTLNDAEDVAAKLKGMGFRVELSLDPTLKDFDKAQDTFESRLGPGVLAFYYFSGHGCEYQGDNYMCMKETPDNVDERRLERTSIQLGKLLEGIRNRGAAFTVVILDACRSVRVTRGTRDASSFGLAEYKPTLPPLRDGGTVIAYATAPRETASDGAGEPGGRNGFYTHHLLKFLAEEKPVRDMLEEVSFEIMEKTQNKQEPWVNAWMGSRRAKRIQLMGLKPMPQPVSPPPRPNPVPPPPRPQPTPPANNNDVKVLRLWREREPGLKRTWKGDDPKKWDGVLFGGDRVEKLDLRSNKLTSLPAEIGQLTSLRVLDLDGNQLTSVPAEIGQLTSLEWLNLWDNRLTSVPAEIGQLTSLRELFLHGNQLTSLPAEIGLITSLTYLDLKGNRLTGLPAEIGQLTSLTYLNLTHNNLTSLPAEIGQLTSLTKLNLYGNQLTGLPAEIGQLTSLRELHLSRNQLTSPPAFIANLKANGCDVKI